MNQDFGSLFIDLKTGLISFFNKSIINKIGNINRYLREALYTQLPPEIFIWLLSINVNEKKKAANNPSEKAFFIVNPPKVFIC